MSPHFIELQDCQCTCFVVLHCSSSVLCLIDYPQEVSEHSCFNFASLWNSGKTNNNVYREVVMQNTAVVLCKNDHNRSEKNGN